MFNLSMSHHYKDNTQGKNYKNKLNFCRPNQLNKFNNNNKSFLIPSNYPQDVINIIIKINIIF